MIKIFLSLILILIALPLYANPCMQMMMQGTTGTAAPPDNLTQVDGWSTATRTISMYVEIE